MNLKLSIFGLMCLWTDFKLSIFQHLIKATIDNRVNGAINTELHIYNTMYTFKYISIEWIEIIDMSELFGNLDHRYLNPSGLIKQ